MSALLAHAALDTTSALGSPLYRVLPGHLPGVAAVALVPLAALLVRWRAGAGDGTAASLVAGYRRLPADERFLAWMLMVTAAIHLGLVIGDEGPAFRILFALDAAAFLVVTRQLLLGLRWRLPAGLLLVASILAYAVVVIAQEPPDQVGLATKLVELAALGVVLRPRCARRLRRLAASGATVSFVVVTGLAAWIGAFAAAGGEGHGHHGAVAMPGTIMAAIEEREPTATEQAAADRFYEQAAAALARYNDPARAAADGYAVEGLAGTDFHAGNAEHAADDRVFDPVRPESLVYAETPQGQVLLGAVYEMPSIGEPGPAIGGPLTHWHAHENVCFSLTPPAFSGLVSPFGDCPVGSIAIPITPEMIHVWLVPGAPDRFGDLDEEWRADYLESFGS